MLDAHRDQRVAWVNEFAGYDNPTSSQNETTFFDSQSFAESIFAPHRNESRQSRCETDGATNKIPLDRDREIDRRENGSMRIFFRNFLFLRECLNRD